MTPEKKTTKKPKEVNPLVLNAEVVGGSIMHRRLGRIVRVTNTLVEVAWENGLRNEWFGRTGRPFHGGVTKECEAITFKKNGRPYDNVWGEPDEDGISIATEGAKQTIRADAEKKQKTNEERAQARARIEADPAYIQRQADLKRYAEMLQGLGANIENGWNDQKDFRIELDGIKPEKMDALVEAIQGALR